MKRQEGKGCGSKNVSIFIPHMTQMQTGTGGDAPFVFVVDPGPWFFFFLGKGLIERSGCNVTMVDLTCSVEFVKWSQKKGREDSADNVVRLQIGPINLFL